eukprot:COSAG06_NODE_576_length_14051_cov_5.354644_14_plen_80_part_00
MLRPFTTELNVELANSRHRPPGHLQQQGEERGGGEEAGLSEAVVPAVQGAGARADESSQGDAATESASRQYTLVVEITP